jgi:hypothetical protein
MAVVGFVNSRTDNITDLTFSERESVKCGVVIVLFVFISEPNLSLVSARCLVLFTEIAYLAMNTYWLKSRI